jgi:hypothetical protein
MSPTEFSSTTVLAPRRADGVAAAVARDFLLVAAAGMAAACIGHLLGRPARMGLGMPLVGSPFASLPRVLVLLGVLARVNRVGAFTGAAVCEVLAHVGLGVPGLGPMAASAPVAAGIVADLAWNAATRWRFASVRLMLTGAVLSGTRVLAAWALMALLVFPARGISGPATRMALAVVGVDVLLGAAAGLLVVGLHQALYRQRMRKSGR